MKKYLFSFTLLTCLGSFQLAEADISTATTPNDLIVQADQTYLLRSNEAQARAALTLYEKAAQADPQSIEARWKASRACWWVADHSSDKKEKLDLFQRGIDMAQAALTLDPQNTDAHFWLGGNKGSFGEVKGVLKSLFLVKPIRAEMATIIKLDPTYDGGGAYRVLGVVNYKVPGFAGGSRKRAFDNLSKALQMAPENPFNLYYLAEFYSTGGEKAKAAIYLKMLADLQTNSAQEKPDLEMMQKKGEALQKKM